MELRERIAAGDDGEDSQALSIVEDGYEPVAAPEPASLESSLKSPPAPLVAGAAKVAFEPASTNMNEVLARREALRLGLGWK